MNAGYRRTDADAAADADPENRARTLKTYWNTCAEKAQGRLDARVPECSA